MTPIRFYLEHGLKLFALAPNSKVPLADSHGAKDATDNPEELAKWFKSESRNNIAVATGAVSGITVLDIDVKNDTNGLDTIRSFAEQGFILPKAPLVETPSSGRHLWFAFESDIGNSVGKLGPGLDIRNDGGYVVAPPSKLPSGHYRWINPISKPFPKLPNWIIQRLKPKTMSKHNEFQGEGNMKYLLDFISQSEKGERNNRLFWAACRMGENPNNADKDELLKAAISIGLDEVEAKKTIDSGLKQGKE